MAFAKKVFISSSHFSFYLAISGISFDGICAGEMDSSHLNLFSPTLLLSGGKQVREGEIVIVNK